MNVLGITEQNRNVWYQFAIFTAIGLTVNAIYVTLFLVIVHFMANQRLIATIIGYLSACLFQYAANSRLTFRRHALNARQFFRYALCVCGGLALSSWLLAARPTWMAIPDFALIVLVAALIAAMNFLLFRYWVYSGVRS